jgi:hypothetical protein
VQVGYLLKPDTPRTVDGKPLKYEAPAGSIPHFDIHPYARPALREVTTTLYFSEGVKKGDAGWSRGIPCASMSGVFMFLNKRLVVPDLDEIPLQGRLVRVVFDSDVTRKTGVAEALLRFCDALHRRGAKVEVVYLPEGPDGAKVGLDDFFVAGGNVTDLDALARPWDGRGPGVRVDAGGDNLEQVRQRMLRAEADNRALKAAIDVATSLPELRTLVATGALVASKVSRGEVDAEGNAIVSPAEAANDWRKKPDTDERLAALNPDGTRPRMPRKQVKPLFTKAVEQGVLWATPILVQRSHGSGATWQDTDWAIAPVTSLADFLNPWIAARTGTLKLRKLRTITPVCPHCGETHPIRRRDFCAGCGAQRDERTIAPPPDPQAAAERGDNLSPVKTTHPHPPVSSRGITFAPALQEPSWLADAPPILESDLTPDRPPLASALDDTPCAPIPLFSSPPPRSVHFDVGAD